MAITFEVDDVAPATEAAPTISVAELVGTSEYVGIEGAPRVLATGTTPALLAAVHHAFAEHRPLVLSPDAVWLTIAHGVAHHVKLHAEELRGRFVRHQGKEALVVEVLAPPVGDEWEPVVAEFRTLLAERIGAGVARLLTCDFSTTGSIERTAGELVLMDAMSPYFDYTVACVCGIPRITLTGTVDDWRAIRARIDVIAELGLEWWTSSLAPIADRLVAAAAGRPDPEFFRAIYKPQKAYGRDIITGWIARLYPYVDRGGCFDERNSLLARGLDEPWPEHGGRWFDGPGIRARDLPRTMSRVPVRITFPMTNDRPRPIALEGGLLAVEQAADGALIPRAAYAVRDAGEDAVVLVRQIREVARELSSGRDEETRIRDGALRHLLREVGGALLFDDPHAWRLRSPDERDDLRLFERDIVLETATRLVDLPDGTCLAVADLHDSAGAVLRLDGAAIEPCPRARLVADDAADFRRRTPIIRTRQSLTEIPVLAGSLTEILANALATGGALDLPVRGTAMDFTSSEWDSAVDAAALLPRLRRDHRIVEADERHNLFGHIVEGELRVGGETWTVVEPSAVASVAVEYDGHQLTLEPRVALPDGTALCGASTWRPCVVRVRLDDLSAPAEFPVLGRSFVQVLTHALDHGELPAPSDTLVSWSNRQRAIR